MMLMFFVCLEKLNMNSKIMKGVLPHIKIQPRSVFSTISHTFHGWMSYMTIKTKCLLLVRLPRIQSDDLAWDLE